MSVEYRADVILPGPLQCPHIYNEMLVDAVSLSTFHYSDQSVTSCELLSCPCSHQVADKETSSKLIGLMVISL